MLSGLFAGLAGVLYAIQSQFAAPDFVFFLVSGETVIYNVIGGIGALVGPAFFLLLREGLSRFLTELLPDPGRTRLHHHRHLHAAGPAWLRPPLAERMARSLPCTARSP
jgi:ABC-type branched-subunit amino acid transport system permease subunit